MWTEAPGLKHPVLNKKKEPTEKIDRSPAEAGTRPQGMEDHQGRVQKEEPTTTGPNGGKNKGRSSRTGSTASREGGDEDRDRGVRGTKSGPGKDNGGGARKTSRPGRWMNQPGKRVKC